MRNRLAVVAFVFLIAVICAAPAPASDVHIDTCDLVPVLCSNIGSDHNGFCDNTDGYGSAYHDIDCWDYSQGSPRSWETECHEDGTDAYGHVSYECTATATVICMGVAGNIPGTSYVTFQCTTDGTPPLKSGTLGQTSQGYPIKGVQCGTISCGCIQPPNQTATLFGNPYYDQSTGILRCN